VSRLLAPVAVFGAVLAAMVALNDGAATPPAPAAGHAGSDYAVLGDNYLARARETGDPAFYSRAERAFGAALRKDPASVDGLVGAGTLAGFRHDFAEQLRLGEEARRVAPQLARPLPVIADAQIELGRYGQAARTIQRLVDLKPGLPAYARVSYFRELHGDTGGRARPTWRRCSVTSSSPTATSPPRGPRTARRSATYTTSPRPSRGSRGSTRRAGGSIGRPLASVTRRTSCP
jgi:tetratricopeptide (TPR) repeat protein